MKGLILIAAYALSGCANTQYRAEWEHVSHPFAGEPFGPSSEEDWLDQLNVCSQKRYGRIYGDACLGYRVNDGGFYGPRLTGSVRVGVLLNRVQQ